MRAYEVVVQRDADGWYVGSVTGLPGCHTQGRSLDQLRDRIPEAIAVCGGPGEARMGGLTFAD